jgi:hypothetical protein
MQRGSLLPAARARLPVGYIRVLPFCVAVTCS